MRAAVWAILLCAAALAALIWLPTADPAEPVGGASGEKIIYVDLRRLSLTLYVDHRQVAHWPVAAGKAGTPSPAGVWSIDSKIRLMDGTFGTRWLGLNCPWGSFGIHGTNAPGSIGSKASSGCIRMLTRHVEELYDLVPLGTTVVVEDAYGTLPGKLSKIEPGDRGNLVLAVQRKLHALDYYDGGLDGIYGRRMQAAVYAFKLDHGLDQTLTVDAETYAALGIMPFE